MTKDDEIKSGLKNAGIPESVFSTTLLKEDMPLLREAIARGSLVRPASASGVYVYPLRKESTLQARRVFYTVAKELFLSGVTVYCLPLSRLIEALRSDELTGEVTRVEKARMVMVLDFYENGAGFPLDASESAHVRAWARRRFEAGKAVSFLSDSPVDQCSSWWPASFLGFINDSVVTQAV